MDFKINSKDVFFGMLFHAIDYYKLCSYSATGHGSHSERTSLKTFLEHLDKDLDKLIEGTQGVEGLFEIEIPKTLVTKSSLEFSEVLFQFIETNSQMFKYSFQKSLIDEIQINLSKLIYNLKYLK